MRACAHTHNIYKPLRNPPTNTHQHDRVQGVRDGIRRVSTRLAQLGAFVQPPVYSWMDAVESYIGNENLPGDCPKCVWAPVLYDA